MTAMLPGGGARRLRRVQNGDRSSQLCRCLLAVTLLCVHDAHCCRRQP